MLKEKYCDMKLIYIFFVFFICMVVFLGVLFYPSEPENNAVQEGITLQDVPAVTPETNRRLSTDIAPTQSFVPNDITIHLKNDINTLITKTHFAIKNSAGMIVDVTSNQSGEITFPHSFIHEAGQLTWLESDHYFSKTIEADSILQTPQITLDRKLAVTGVVQLAGGGIPEMANVELSNASLILKSTNSRFRYFPLHPGIYRIASKDSVLLGEEKLVQAGETVTLHLSDSAVVIVSASSEHQVAKSGVNINLRSTPESGFIYFSEWVPTNDIGRSRFEEIQRGVYRAVADHAWYQKTQSATFAVDQMTETIHIQLAHVHSISGYVYDRKTTQPISGANVIAVKDDSPAMRTDMDDSKTAQYIATTPENGFYRIDTIPSGRYFVFVDDYPGYITGDTTDLEGFGTVKHKRVLVTKGENAENVNFYLEPQWKVSGRVLDPNHQPLSGQLVSLMLSYKNAATRTYIQKTLEQPNMSAITSVTGYYEIMGSIVVDPVIGTGKMEYGKILVESKHPKYGKSSRVISKDGPLQPGDIKQDVDIQFLSKGVLRGTVSDTTGKPVPGAVVDLWQDEKAYQGGFSRLHFYTETDEDGLYEFFVSQEDTFYIRAFADGYRSSTATSTKKTVHISMDKVTTRNFILQKGESETLEGTVVDESGNPLEGITLYLETILPLYGNDKLHQTVSDQYGFFQFSLDAYEPEWLDFKLYSNQSVKDKPFHILALENERYKYINPEQTYPPVYGWGEKDIRIVMQSKDTSTATITGHAVHDNDEPVTQFDVVVIPQSAVASGETPHPSYTWSSVFSQRGEFYFEGLPVRHGPFIISVRAEDGGIFFSHPVHVNPNDRINDIIIRMESTGSIQGIVVDSGTNQPLSGVHVFSFLPASPDQIERLQNRVNRFRYNIPQHQSRLSAHLPSGITNEQGRFNLRNMSIVNPMIRIKKNAYQEKIIPINRLNSQQDVNLGIIEMIRTGR